MVDGHRVEGTLRLAAGRCHCASATGGNAKLGLHRRARRRSAGRSPPTARRTRALVLPATVAPLAAHMIEKVPPDLSKFLICPMPGLLVTLHVAEGDSVEPGQPLATVEAMKMENILRAEKAGTVATLRASEGDSLAVDQVILELE